MLDKIPAMYTDVTTINVGGRERKFCYIIDFILNQHNQLYAIAFDKDGKIICSSASYFEVIIEETN